MRRSAARPNPAPAGVTGTTGPGACFGSRSREGDGSPLVIGPRSGCRRGRGRRPCLWHSPLQAGLAGDVAARHRHRTAALEGGQFLGVELIRHPRLSTARHMPILVAGRGLAALWHPSGAVRPTSGGRRRGHRGHRGGGRGRHRGSRWCTRAGRGRPRLWHSLLEAGLAGDTLGPRRCGDRKNRSDRDAIQEMLHVTVLYGNSGLDDTLQTACSRRGRPLRASGQKQPVCCSRSREHATSGVTYPTSLGADNMTGATRFQALRHFPCKSESFSAADGLAPTAKDARRYSIATFWPSALARWRRWSRTPRNAAGIAEAI